MKSKKNQKNDIVTSRDIYQIVYFLSKTSCQIKSIETTQDLDKPLCIITVSGVGLKKLELEYLNSEAPVNALSYRKSLSYVRSLIYGELGKLKKQGGAK